MSLIEQVVDSYIDNYGEDAENSQSARHHHLLMVLTPRTVTTMPAPVVPGSGMMIPTTPTGWAWVVKAAGRSSAELICFTEVTTPKMV
jgi:hypothetical protein